MLEIRGVTKMKKILAFALILTLTLPLLFACSGGANGIVGGKAGDFAQYYNSSLSASLDNGYTKAETIAIPQNASSLIADGGFYYYLDPARSKYVIHSVKSGALALELAQESTPSIVLYDDYFTVAMKKTDGEENLSVYSETGALLASVDGDNTAFSQSTNGFVIGDIYYHLKDGAVKTYTIPPFLSPSSVTFVENYAIYKTGNSIVYYNEKFEAIAFYEIPGNAYSSSAYYLSDGKVLVQYRIVADPSDNSFDLLTYTSGSTTKSNIYTVLFDPAKKKTSELDLDVLIQTLYTSKDSLSGFAFDDIFTDNVENVLCYYALKDGVADTSELHYVTLSNDGKVGDRLDDFVENQKGLIQPQMNGTLFVPTKTGYAIIDENGKIKTNLVTKGTATHYGYRSTNAIYDTDMKLAVDLSTTTSRDYNNRAFLYTKTVGGARHYFIYTKDGEKEITSPKGTLNGSGVKLKEYYYTVEYYVATEYSSYVTAYAFDGTELFTAILYVDYDMFPDPEIISETGDAAIVQYYDAETGKLAYARLSK